MTDLQIATCVKPLHIKEIGSKLNIAEDDLEYYGKYKAKLPSHLIDESRIAQGSLILVTPFHRLQQEKEKLRLRLAW